MLTALGALIITNIPVPSVALTDAEIENLEECASIERPLTRLSCYDGIMGQKSLQNESLPTDGNGWKLETELNKLTNFENLTLQLASNEKIKVQYANPVEANLTIGCINNNTSFVIWFGGNYMSEIGDFGIVDYRIGDQPADSVRMTSTAENRALALERGVVAIPFVSSLLEHDTLLISARPINYDDGTVVATFNISGLDDAIIPLRRACSW